MTGLFSLFTALLFVLSGCAQQPNHTDAVKQTAYKWEKAFMDSDYQTQQQLLYKVGTYEVDKTAQKQNSGLKENDIQYQIYYDKKMNWYDVLTTYMNPLQGNKVEERLVIRQKGGEFKVDEEKTMDLKDESLLQIQTETDQIACINCTK